MSWTGFEIVMCFSVIKVPTLGTNLWSKRVRLPIRIILWIRAALCLESSLGAMWVLLTHGVVLRRRRLPLLIGIVLISGKVRWHYIHAHWHVNTHRRKHSLLLMAMRIDRVAMELRVHWRILWTISPGISHRMNLSTVVDRVCQRLLALVVHSTTNDRTRAQVHGGWHRR